MRCGLLGLAVLPPLPPPFLCPLGGPGGMCGACGAGGAMGMRGRACMRVLILPRTCVSSCSASSMLKPCSSTSVAMLRHSLRSASSISLVVTLRSPCPSFHTCVHCSQILASQALSTVRCAPLGRCGGLYGSGFRA